MVNTKAELQVQLRALMRGGPGRLPISSMKKHELEAYIDSITELKANKASKYGQLYAEQQELNKKALEDAQTRPLAHRGHLGPRPIPVHDEEVEGEETIKVPGQPPQRLLKAPPVNKPREPKPPKEPKAEKPEPEPKAPKPKKAVSITEPLSGKSGAVKYCPCSCPDCPHRRS